MLQAADVKFLQARQRDDTGRVFLWNDRVFRAIFPEQEQHVRTMLSNGFLARLISEGCFPDTEISDIEVDGYTLVLEHQRIWPVTYPQDWTFSMLKDAALMVCKTALIAKEYGYNMRDCHGLNVLFDGVTPKFIDLGSFIPDTIVGWRPYEEFLRFYYYPLKIWQHNSFVGKLSIFSGNLVHHEAYWRSEHPMLRRISPRVLAKLIDSYLRFERLASAPDNGAASWKGRVMRGVINKGIVRTHSTNLAGLLKRVRALGHEAGGSTWAGYHDQLGEKAKRFDRLIKIINELGGGLQTAVDIGGNQGRFTQRILRETAIERAVCIDADDNAVDAGYRRAKAEGEGNVAFVHYDPMGGIVKLRFQHPNERFASDVAIALALTHHLILGQGYDVDFVLQNLGAYARKYVVIEFMPLGLWVKGQTSATPSWYTTDWFRTHFTKHFDLVLEEQLKENNIVFVGRVRSANSETHVRG